MASSNRVPEELLEVIRTLKGAAQQAPPRGRPKDKAALVGARVAGLPCCDWLQEDIPTISDFDLVFVYEPSLAELIEEFAALEDAAKLEAVVRAISWLSAFRGRLQEVLESDGAVYGIVRAKTSGVGATRKRDRGGDLYYYVGSDHWCPIPVDRKPEKGDTMSQIDSRFEVYLSHLAAWDFYYEYTGRDSYGAIGEINDGHYRSEVRVSLTPLAGSRRGLPLAAELTYGIHDRGSSTGTFRKEPSVTSGSLYLLPDLERQPEGAAVRLLLQAVLGLQGESARPEWVSAYFAPGEEAAQRELQEAEAALLEASEHLRNAESALNTAQKAKRLLFESGWPLQEAAREAFEEMGIRTEASPVSDEFVLVGDPKVLVEVKGLGKSAGLTDFGQLVRDRGSYTATLSETPRALLLVNAFRNLPLKERNTKDKPEFPDNVIKAGQQQDVCLMTTAELFRGLRLIADGKLTGADILAQIQTTQGVLQLSPREPPG